MPSATPQAILITGCSSGIGRALAVELERRGHHVFATARAPESLSDLSPSITKLVLDVTDPKSIGDAVDAVIAEAGHIDVLVNNAGMNLVGPLVELRLEDLRRLFDTNVVGVVAVSQAVFPHMAERRAGRIVNVGSIVHLLATPFGGAYAATKAAVHLISVALRMEVRPFGIDVIEVQPGAVRSSLSKNATAGLDRYRAPDSHYRGAFEGIVRRAYESQQGPTPTEEFASDLADAVLAKEAPRRVRLGKGSGTIPWLMRLPASVVERGMARRFGLGALGR